MFTFLLLWLVTGFLVIFIVRSYYDDDAWVDLVGAVIWPVVVVYALFKVWTDRT